MLQPVKQNVDSENVAHSWITESRGCARVSSPSEKRGETVRVRSVGICDTDIEYATVLMDSLNHKGRDEIRAYVFSDRDALRKYLEKNDLDIVLFGEEMEEPGVRSVFLSDNPDYKDTSVVESRVIFKYQSVSIIFSELQKLLAPAEISVRKRCRFIGVYSPLGRCGKTRLAMALAAMDEVRGGLYIGLENYSGAGEIPCTDVFYLVKQRSGEITRALESAVIRKGDLCFLYASGTYMDSRDVQASDIEWLNQELAGSGRFSTVCYDIGSAAIEDLEILKNFDLLYIPTLPDSVSDMKLTLFRKMVRSMGLGEEIARAIEIEVPDTEPDSPEMIRAIVNSSRR